MGGSDRLHRALGQAAGRRTRRQRPVPGVRAVHRLSLRGRRHDLLGRTVPPGGRRSTIGAPRGSACLPRYPEGTPALDPLRPARPGMEHRFAPRRSAGIRTTAARRWKHQFDHRDCAGAAAARGSCLYPQRLVAPHRPGPWSSSPDSRHSLLCPGQIGLLALREERKPHVIPPSDRQSERSKGGKRRAPPRTEPASLASTVGRLPNSFPVPVGECRSEVGLHVHCAAQPDLPCMKAADATILLVEDVASMRTLFGPSSGRPGCSVSSRRATGRKHCQSWAKEPSPRTSPPCERPLSALSDSSHRVRPATPALEWPRAPLPRPFRSPRSPTSRSS